MLRVTIDPPAPASQPTFLILDHRPSTSTQPPNHGAKNGASFQENNLGERGSDSVVDERETSEDVVGSVLAQVQGQLAQVEAELAVARVEEQARIVALHDYNDSKDATQKLLSIVAHAKQVTLASVAAEFGVDDLV